MNLPLCLENATVIEIAKAISESLFENLFDDDVDSVTLTRDSREAIGTVQSALCPIAAEILNRARAARIGQKVLLQKNHKGEGMSELRERNERYRLSRTRTAIFSEAMGGLCSNLDSTRKEDVEATVEWLYEMSVDYADKICEES